MRTWKDRGMRPRSAGICARRHCLCAAATWFLGCCSRLTHMDRDTPSRWERATTVASPRDPTRGRLAHMLAGDDAEDGEFRVLSSLFRLTHICWILQEGAVFCHHCGWRTLDFALGMAQVPRYQTHYRRHPPLHPVPRRFWLPLSPTMRKSQPGMI